MVSTTRNIIPNKKREKKFYEAVSSFIKVTTCDVMLQGFNTVILLGYNLHSTSSHMAAPCREFTISVFGYLYVFCLTTCFTICLIHP